LAGTLGLSSDVIERHLQYCTDYTLATWKKKDGTGIAAMTDRGHDHLTRQDL